MSYDIPFRRDFTYAGYNFANAGTRFIPGRPGRKIKTVDVSVSPTTAFVGPTTAGRVQVGDGVTPNLFADLALGAPGAGTQVGQVAEANSFPSGLTGLVYGKHIYPATGAGVTVTFVPPTGAGAAGVGDVEITVEYI